MNILTVDYQSPNADKQFAESLHKTGFGIIKNHPIPWEKITQSYKEWEDFFHHPNRFDYKFNPDTQDGYVSSDLSETAKGHTEKDIKEFYHLYFPWGRYPEMISENSRELFELKFEFAKELLSWIEAALPAEIQQKLAMPLSETIAKDRTLHRILYYPPLKGDEPEGAVRAAAHEDINLITILPAASASGLEAKDASGNWHRVEPDPKTLVVNIGDMLQEMTDFYYISTTHRVVKPKGEQAGKPRMSMPLFLHPAQDVPMSDRYPTARDYWNERMQELGLM